MCPQLPTYNSKERLWVDQPEMIRTGAGTKEEAVAGVLGKAQEIGQKWSNALDAIQLTTFKANTSVAIADIKSRAESDPNANAYDIYVKELDKLKEKHLKGFKNKAIEQQAAFDLDHDIKMVKIELGGEFKKKQIIVGQVSALKLIDLEKSNYINAENEQGRLQAVKNINSLVDFQVAHGLWGAKEGDTLKEHSIKEAQDVLKDTEALKRVKLKELARAEELAINANEQNYIKMKVNGVDKLGMAISREDLIAMVKRDMNLEPPMVSLEFANSYINALKSPKAVNAKTIDKDFADIISEINKGIKSSDKIRKELLNMLSDGYISETDFGSASIYMEMLADKKPSDLVANNIRKGWFGIESVTENTTGKEESRSRISRSFISNLSSGVDPQNAAVMAIRNEVLFLHPEAITYPDGMPVIDSKGIRKIIMPNGDILPDNTIKPKKTIKKK